jgi:hypothetical protein
VGNKVVELTGEPIISMKSPANGSFNEGFYRHVTCSETPSQTLLVTNLDQQQVSVYQITGRSPWQRIKCAGESYCEYLPCNSTPDTSQVFKTATDEDFIPKHTPRHQDVSARDLLVSALAETACSVCYIRKLLRRGPTVGKTRYVPKCAQSLERL